MQRAIAVSAEHSTDWARMHALPLWATVGYDAQKDRLEEQLTTIGECDHLAVVINMKSPQAFV